MTGGYTASIVCQLFGVEAIQLSHNLFRGISLGFLIGGMAAGKPIVIKPGAFGANDTLAAIAGSLRGEKLA